MVYFVLFRFNLTHMASSDIFVVDASLSLCIVPGLCALDVKLFDKTKLVIPGCGQNQTFNIQGRLPYVILVTLTCLPLNKNILAS